MKTWTIAFGLAWAATASAFYLPGMAATEYTKGQELTINVNRITPGWMVDGSEATSSYAYDYYDQSFGFCQPEGGPTHMGGSIGSILFGDRVYDSPMKVKMLEDQDCIYECTSEVSEEQVKFLIQQIVQASYHHWTVDGLPVAGAYIYENWENGQLEEGVYDDVIPLGGIAHASDTTAPDNVELYNHIDFEIEYHENPKDKYRVVGAIARVSSRYTPGNAENFQCDAVSEPMNLYNGAGGHPRTVKIPYSYGVKWKESPLAWATRWDKYLHVYEPYVNWFALINSTVLVFLLGALCSLALVRILRKDIAQYNEVDLNDEPTDEMGWKLIHGDVFRAPRDPMLFAVTAGTGAQLIATIVITVFLSVLGLLSPASRGAFSTAFLLMATIFGGLGGFVSSIFYKTWGGENWQLNLILTPVMVPSFVFAIFLFVNILLVIAHASGAVPFGNMAALICMWILGAVPLSFFFGFLGRKKNWFEAPVRVNQIPRQIPPQPWYLQTIPVILLSGILPFLSISLQLYYIISAIWFQRLYYMFGFLFASIVAMVLICAAVNALVLYLTLSGENYHWQWRAFHVGGSPAIYIFLYSIFYRYKYMNLVYFEGTFIYLAYTFLGSALCYLALGFVGILVSHQIVYRIYKSIKVE